MRGLTASRLLCVCLALSVLLALTAPACGRQEVVAIRDSTGQQVGLYTAS